MTWYEPTVEGSPPTPRVSVTGCLVNQTVYFFGGFDGATWINDLHTLDLQNMIWNKKKTYGSKPTPRCRHTANYLNGKLYIFGGNDCDMSFNNIFTLWIEIYVPNSTLSFDMRRMLLDQSFADIILVIEDGKYRIPAHKCILSNRCEFFKIMLSSQMRES